MPPVEEPAMVTVRKNLREAQGFSGLTPQAASIPSDLWDRMIYECRQTPEAFGIIGEVDPFEPCMILDGIVVYNREYKQAALEAMACHLHNGGCSCAACLCRVVGVAIQKVSGIPNGLFS